MWQIHLLISEAISQILNSFASERIIDKIQCGECLGEM